MPETAFYLSRIFALISPAGKDFINGLSEESPGLSHLAIALADVELPEHALVTVLRGESNPSEVTLVIHRRDFNDRTVCLGILAVIESLGRTQQYSAEDMLCVMADLSVLLNGRQVLRLEIPPESLDPTNDVVDLVNPSRTKIRSIHPFGRVELLSF